MTPEQAERVDRSLRAAIAEQRRAHTRRRRVKWALAVGAVVVAGMAAAAAFGLGAPAQLGAPRAGARAGTIAGALRTAATPPSVAAALGPAVAGWVASTPEPGVTATAVAPRAPSRP